MISGSVKNNFLTILKKAYETFKTSPNDVLWTSRYGPVCNAKGRPTPTSSGLPIPTYRGCPNRCLVDVQIWCPNRTSSWRTHMIIYVTPSYVPYQHPESMSCRCPKDTPYVPICNAKGCILPTSWGRHSETSEDILPRCPKDVVTCFY